MPITRSCTARDVHVSGRRSAPRRSRSSSTVPTRWELTTAAPRTGRSRSTRGSIDELYDHPIHLGLVRTLPVPAKVPVELAIWGERAPGGPFDEERLATDLAAIVDDHIARFGEAPFAALHVHPDARRTTRTAGSSIARRA